MCKILLYGIVLELVIVLCFCKLFKNKLITPIMLVSICMPNTETEHFKHYALLQFLITEKGIVKNTNMLASPLIANHLSKAEMLQYQILLQQKNKIEPNYLKLPGTNTVPESMELTHERIKRITRVKT